MAIFNHKQKPGDYELIREGEDVILRINYEGFMLPPSIEDSGNCMALVIEKLIEVGNVTKILLTQKRDYEYDYGQTQLLLEISKLYMRIIKQNIASIEKLSPTGCNKCVNGWYTQMQEIVYHLLKTDPLGAYVELKRLFRKETIRMQKTMDEACVKCEHNFISILNYLLKHMEKTKLVAIAKPYLAGYQLGDRSVYTRIFNPTIKPDFMYTKLMATFPMEGDELDSYTVGGTEVTIFKLPDTVVPLYHILPPEFKLSEEKYDLLDMARKIMSEHKPKKSEFVDPERMRSVFANVGNDLIEELADLKNVKLKEKDLSELSEILIRYTVGFGLIEVLLQDEKIQDISINAPMGQIPIFIVHADHNECNTNILPTMTEAESWASKLRLISGRPLDEANPILDTELILPTARARVAAITQPLNPYGIAYSFRRHRDKPWTLPLFVKTNMLSDLSAGALSFLIDGARTMLVAGTRSAGKSSLLGAMMVELMRKYRIITIEDTLELPTTSLRRLGYNIQPMKVASALSKGGAEVAADEGIRTTLRLGDSSLIVGEVRSTEARALYEAMRVGALANLVAGTIHGDSPYGVYDRVVNDLGVPKTSFKATDIIVVANPIRSADGLHRWRRVTSITEVRKFWEDDPLTEGGFVELFKYNSKSDALEPTPDLLNGESDILKSIAGNVKEWAGNWDAVWDNILLRADIKRAMVDAANTIKDPDMLEARFVINCNDQYHKISDEVKDELGSLDRKRIMFEWSNWFNRAIKKKDYKS